MLLQMHAESLLHFHHHRSSSSSMASFVTLNRPSSNLHSLSSFCFITSPLPSSSTHQWQLKRRFEKRKLLRLCASYEVDGGFSDTSGGRKEAEETKWNASQYEALLKGGEQVTSVLEEIAKLLEDMNMDEGSEKLAVELAAQGVIGKRVDQMESGFMMALDYMIQLAEKDQDDKVLISTFCFTFSYFGGPSIVDSLQRKSILEVIKETVLSHLTKKCPPHVQVIGLLCRTPEKESRQELLRRVAAGGGAFKSENGTKIHLPGANLNEIANQADDLLETMESRPVVPDRRLLARLVLIREEARNMMGGGILDERNDRGLNTLPESEVNFLTKLVALRPGKTVQEMIKNVMQGKDEGADNSSSDEENTTHVSSGIAGRASVTGYKPLPVRPGMFLETVTKVLGGIYSGNISGITAQHLEWGSI
ncbi:protein PEP-RELATED DEVELOPMENT ARRESTED 1, chloroplastic isoform X2 [Camellia sinensis]|uniref:protein PEP-RELATED DEVELOPMENT ARRESTED 1, chloroplastic isoform X2 n=1 Tax=Camellia sinensis TaxID=4442 RepID=UPI00103592CF|nr:protein PEP-RELATED DEVELOPMENT ARRESTED 1, chloroplastic isoform X2 [Camellia sinensis]